MPTRIEGDPVSNRLDMAKQQLLAASQLGLASHRAEIETLLAGLEQQEQLVGRLRSERDALTHAMTMQDSIIDDLNSRINALEAAIRDYLDPARSRLGASVLITVLEKELGEDVDMQPIDSES